MVKSIVAGLLVPLLFDAVTVTLKLPAADGCPLMTPVTGSRLKPSGRVPVAKAKLLGLPAAEIASEKATATLPVRLADVSSGGAAGATGVPSMEELASPAPTLFTALI
jgi:hypothetical protein